MNKLCTVIFLEEAGVIDTVGENRHILDSDCTREFLSCTQFTEAVLNVPGFYVPYR